MNTFVIGQKVRVTESYGADYLHQDGSFAKLHGAVGEVVGSNEDFVEVRLSYGGNHHKYRYLFLPEELEAV